MRRGAAAVLLLTMGASGGCVFRERSLDELSDGGGSPGDAPLVDGSARDASPGDAPPGDARRDGGGPDARPDARTCDWELPTTNFDPCGSLPVSNGTVEITAETTFDTDTGAASPGTFMSGLQAQSGATSLRVIVFESLVLRAPLRFTGTHPVLIVAQDRIELVDDGELDVSAGTVGSRGEPGPGGDDGQ